MTEQLQETTSEATESPVSDEQAETGQDTTPTPEADTGEPEASEKVTPQREAAKWRVKYREAEARVARLQRAEVARQAAETLIDGDDLFASVDLADLRDEAGDLDADKITEQVTALIEAKPHLRKPAFRDGSGIGTRGETPPRPASWSDVLAG